MKNPIVAVIAVVVIVAAVGVIVWQSVGGGGADTEELTGMVFICSNEECNYQYTREGSPEDAGMGMMAEKCPKCGQETAQSASQCPHCKQHFLPRQDKTLTECPKCNKSLVPGK